MKTSKLAIAVLTALSALLIAGCAGTGASPIVGTPHTAQYTVANMVPVVMTEMLEPSTPGLPPQIVTVTNLVERIQVLTETNTVWVVNTNWVQAIETAQAVNQIANPTPTAPLVNLALAGLAAGLGWFARIKNQKLQGVESLLQVVIDGVEKDTSPTVKGTIQAIASRRGLEPALNARINEG